MGQPTLETVIVRSILSRAAEGAGRRTLETTRAMVDAAPEVNERGRAAEVLSLADHMRSSLCTDALRAVGDHMLADQTAIHSVIDRDSAAVAAHNLRDYRASIDQLPADPRPSAATIRRQAETVLDETVSVLDLLADSLEGAGLSERDEIAAGRHAAIALCAAFEAAIIVDLPGSTRSMLYALQTVIHRPAS